MWFKKNLKIIIISLMALIIAFIFFTRLGILYMGGPPPGYLLMEFIISLGLLIISMIFYFFISNKQMKKIVIYCIIYSLVLFAIVLLTASSDMSSYNPNYCSISEGVIICENFYIEDNKLYVELANKGTKNIEILNITLENDKDSQTLCVSETRIIDSIQSGEKITTEVCEFNSENGTFKGNIIVYLKIENSKLVHHEDGSIRFNIEDIKKRNRISSWLYGLHDAPKNIKYNIFGILR